MMRFVLSLMPAWAWALALACILATAGATGYLKGDANGAARVQARWDAQRDADVQAVNEASMRAAQAAHRYQEWRLLQLPKIVTRTVEVDRVIQADPVWSGAAVPERVRQQLEAAAAEFDKP